MVGYTGYWIEGNRIHGPGDYSGEYYLEEGWIHGPKPSDKCLLQVELSTSGHRISHICGPDRQRSGFYIFHHYIYGPDENVPWLR